MPPKKCFGRGKRKFYGNRFTSLGSRDCVITSTNQQDVMSTPPSASRQKLKYLSDVSTNDDQNTLTDCVSIIAELSALCSLLKNAVVCALCGKGGIKIEEDFEGRRGVASKSQVVCDFCGVTKTGYSSGLCKGRAYNTNIRLAYGMRCIGKGRKAAQTFCAIMNLPPPTRFEKYTQLLLESLGQVSAVSMKKAVEETVLYNEGDTDIAAAFDGTWQKRGHLSLNGVVTATSLENGKVIDIECMTKYCHGCKVNKQDHVCVQNFSGYSGGMESEGVLRIFQRSEENYGVRYVKYLGDGDSKGFGNVLENMPYGRTVKIEKLECVGHVQKRMGTRLRKLIKDMKGKKLSDGKPIGGRGRLTKEEVDKLQLYYGLAIRRNQGDLEAMKKAVWATFFHKASTDDHPQHALCNSGVDTWCGYKKAIENGEIYTHHHSLPFDVLEAIKPIYRDLSDNKLLSRCLHGKTQNVNECFNHVIWERLPKTVFVGFKTMRLGVLDAVICFNDGAVSRCEVLELLGVTPGFNMRQALTAIDSLRVAEGDKWVLQATKEARIAKRSKKRKREDEEHTNQEYYAAGGF